MVLSMNIGTCCHVWISIVILLLIVDNNSSTFMKKRAERVEEGLGQWKSMKMAHTKQVKADDCGVHVLMVTICVLYLGGATGYWLTCKDLCLGFDTRSR